jgi:hypothetical protein
MTPSEPVFLLQLVDRDGTVARYRAGGRAELDFIETCVSAIMAKGVGFGRTAAHVERDVRTGITEAIRTLKKTARHAL